MAFPLMSKMVVFPWMSKMAAFPWMSKTAAFPWMSRSQLIEPGICSLMWHRTCMIKDSEMRM